MEISLLIFIIISPFKELLSSFLILNLILFKMGGINKKSKKEAYSLYFSSMVHLAGIEPVRVTSLDPKSSASASSAIGAALLLNNIWTLVSSKFTIPIYEEKNHLCVPRKYLPQCCCGIYHEKHD